MDGENVWVNITTPIDQVNVNGTLGWTPGVVKLDPSLPQTEVRVKLVKFNNKEVVVPQKSIITRTSNEFNFNVMNDLIKMDELNEASLLCSLRERFSNDIIYTNIGPMIVSLNPFRKIHHYDDKFIPQYRSSPNRSKTLPPHIFSLANTALTALTDSIEPAPQSMIISGESGAGKTEATKIVLNFLTACSESHTEGLAQKILATNPILEAFGNAKTIKNNNSSRFGKLIILNYDKSSYITGASIKNYLLENPRVVHQDADERNYHIFYMLLKGAPIEFLRKYRLDPNEKYHYLTNGILSIEDVNERESFEKLIKAFQNLGFSNSEIDEFFRIISAVLHLGNIEFSGTEKVTIKNPKALAILCSIVQVESGGMSKALTERYLKSGTRTSVYTIPLSYEQAIENRDAMARAMYTKLFDYLVSRINQFLSSPQSNKFIAVLDIYGFEIFPKNSLEQLCINYANEKLHEQFNQNIFKAEQEEYTSEGISWKDIQYRDNAGCIELIEDPRKGILAMIDEEGQLPRGNEIDLVAKLVRSHRPNKFFTSNPRIQDEFGINHFAGTVNYNIKGFLQKNKKTISEALNVVMGTSELTVIKQLFGEERDSRSSTGSTRAIGTTAGAKKTVFMDFKKDLLSLIEILNASQRHYIRCVKPNDEKKPKMFHSDKVIEQLNSNGVLETVHLRKAGYSHKMPIDNFILRYSALKSFSKFKNQLAADISLLLPNKSDWTIGHTKVFLRANALEFLESKRKTLLEQQVLVIQTHIRRFYSCLMLARFKRQYRAIITIQAHIRRASTMRLVLNMREALLANESLREQSAIILQSSIRRFWVMLKAIRVKREMMIVQKREQEDQQRKKEQEERRRELEERKREQERKRELEEMQKKRDQDEMQRRRELEDAHNRKREDLRRKQEELQRKREEEKNRMLDESNRSVQESIANLANEINYNNNGDKSPKESRVVPLSSRKSNDQNNSVKKTFTVTRSVTENKDLNKVSDVEKELESMQSDLEDKKLDRSKTRNRVISRSKSSHNSKELVAPQEKKQVIDKVTTNPPRRNTSGGIAAKQRVVGMGKSPLALKKAKQGDNDLRPIESTDIYPLTEQQEVNEEIEKQRRLRTRTISETVDTERDYIQDIKIALEVFADPMTREGIITSDESLILFGNLRELIDINIAFLGKMEEKIQEAEYKTAIHDTVFGEIFAEMAVPLLDYESYCTKQTEAFAFLEDSKKENEEFNRFLGKAMTDSRCRNLDLQSFLIKPLQRLCKYPLLLREIIRFTPEDHPDHELLPSATEKINATVTRVNAAQQRAEKAADGERRAVMQILNMLKDDKKIETIGDLNKAGRKLLISGPVECTLKKHKKKEYIVYVFTDVLIFTIPKGSGYNVDHILHIKGCHVTEIAHEDGTYGLEMVDTSGTVINFTFKSVKVKQDWIKIIRAQIKLYKEQETRKANLKLSQSSPSITPSKKHNNSLSAPKKEQTILLRSNTQSTPKLLKSGYQPTDNSNSNSSDITNTPPMRRQGTVLNRAGNWGGARANSAQRGDYLMRRGTEGNIEFNNT